MNNEAAKKLTLQEIANLPETTVIWRSIEDTDLEGIEWHCSNPVMIAVSGIGGIMIGADKDSYFEYVINEDTINNPVLSFWNKKPDDNQLSGIPEKEYNSILNPFEPV